MKAASFFKMSVNNYQSICHHISEDFNDHNKTNYEKYAVYNSGEFTLFCSTISKTVNTCQNKVLDLKANALHARCTTEVRKNTCRCLYEVYITVRQN